MVGLNAVVSWPKEQWGMNPSALAEMRPGAYDIHERVRDMNRNGVLASMCFPSMAGFSGRTFQEAKDKDLSLVMLKAYNDWHIDEWCATYPGRFLPQAILPLWDLDATIEELRRVAAKGALAVSMPELPHTQGYPSYHSEWWDPFFTAMSDLGVVMSLHIGQGLNAINLPDINFDEYMVLSTQVTVLAVQDLLWGHALRQFPDSRSPSPRVGSAGSRSCWTGSTATTRISAGRVRTSGRSSLRRSCASTLSPASSPTPRPSSSTRTSGST